MRLLNLRILFFIADFLSSSLVVAVNHLKKVRGEIWPKRSEKKQKKTPKKTNYQDDDKKFAIKKLILIYIYIYIYVCVCVCVCKCVCERERKRQRDRQTDSQAVRQTERQRDSQSNKYTLNSTISALMLKLPMSVADKESCSKYNLICCWVHFCFYKNDPDVYIRVLSSRLYADLIDLLFFSNYLLR